MLAQHSSGGGSSAGSSGGGGSHGGSAGGGGSHSSSSGGSSSSGSSHSSGGSAAHGSSVSHGSSGHSSSSGSASNHSGGRESHSNAAHSMREPNSGLRAKTEPSTKRGFFSFLRHSIGVRKPKPEPGPKPVADLRHRICLNGPCTVCPTGQVHAGGGCAGGFTANHTSNFCSRLGIWSSSACLQQNPYWDECGGLRMALERQAQRMQAAESAQQSACAAGPRQECSEMTSTAQSEASLYREFENRYRMCRQSSPTRYWSGRYAIGGYSSGLRFDPLGIDLDYP
jgi:hypothetical protein